ncbi:MAG TPA: phosphate ABC transporter permease PstA, partial [Acidimicrobiales bacterium]|nr:phosphate ABC transporter permease PstA [Acidimicrobiales bacterium]
MAAVRHPTESTPADHATMVGCAASALALTWLIFTRLTEGVGWFGFLLVAYLAFLALFGIVTADRLGLTVATDRVATVAISSGALVLAAPLVWLIGYIVVKGLPTLRLDFFVDDQRAIGPTDPATEGGGSHAIVGTLQQVALALTLTVPLSLATAVFLNETRSRLRRPVRIFVDAMSGLPSIVTGLFIFAVLVVPFSGTSGPLGWEIFNFNGFMASLALAMIMLPTVTRTVEVVLRLVPDGLREASLAMGASRARTVWSVVLPTARSGLTTAIVLGVARAVGETAPLLFTAFGYDLMNANPFDRPQESLPLFVYRFIRQPDAASRARGFTGALVLLIVVLALFLTARFAARDRSAGGRAARRRAVRDTRIGPEAAPPGPPAPGTAAVPAAPEA